MARARRSDAARDSARGRAARNPAEIPARGWKDILRRVKERLARDRLGIVAAGVAFYALLAIFPAIASFVSIYGLLFEPREVARQVSQFAHLLPPDASRLLLDQLTKVAESSGQVLGWAAAGALLFALWSAAKGTKALMEALNVAYGEEEHRGFVRLNGTALLLTFGAILGTVAAIGLVIALPAILGLVGLGRLVETTVSVARWPLLALDMVLGLAVLYRYGPDRAEPRWSWVSWGAAAATVMWLVGSGLFSWYVASIGNFNETYGSMGAIVILLIWFLLTAYVILIGAEINAETERQTRVDTTSGPEKPLGRRGAYAADSVAGSR
jgi:membrane protein